ncbi:hypothetical protein, partial [Streptomyces sp. Tu 6176]|uniref:hypothetical protein n=1 Tax=Streptomyces sp. Tu 6176 TaxID=1470557 RepID=UPI003B635DAA
MPVSQGMPGAASSHGPALPAAGPAVSVHLPAVFVPAPLPREGRIVLWDPDAPASDALSDPARPAAGAPPVPTTLTVVRPHGAVLRRRTVAALSL